jgi:hypothetical protein
MEAEPGNQPDTRHALAFRQASVLRRVPVIANVGSAAHLVRQPKTVQAVKGRLTFKGGRTDEKEHRVGCLILTSVQIINGLS